MSASLRSRPRVVIFDSRSHTGDVLEALRRVKSDSYPGVVPAVVLSKNDPASFDAGFRAGADEVEINGAPTAGDIFTAAPNAGRVLFTRANLIPFTVDFSAERLTVNGFGGDDTFNGAAGLAPLTLLALNGGTGDDSLSGGDGPDLITGGDGNDKLDGGGGNDRVVGDRSIDSVQFLVETRKSF